MTDLPSRFKVTGDFPDPFYIKPGLRWRLRRWLDPNSHRVYVGADAGGGDEFLEACRFQLDFMIAHGLQRDSVLLDLGCGCLRAGVHFINYLDAGRYLGMDISAEVVKRGVARELGLETFSTKAPEFVISDRFEFTALSQRPDFILANSVFTHLPSGELRACLQGLRDFLGERSAVFFATFSEAAERGEHEGPGHYLGGTEKMTYTVAEMHALGSEAGWATEYIGEWGHPKNAWDDAFRHQMMFRFAAG